QQQYSIPVILLLYLNNPLQKSGFFRYLLSSRLGALWLTVRKHHETTPRLYSDDVIHLIGADDPVDHLYQSGRRPGLLRPLAESLGTGLADRLCHCVYYRPDHSEIVAAV